MNVHDFSLISDRPLIVYLDFKSPYAYLAVEPTRQMARELGIEIDWRPFVLDIPSYLGSAKLGAAGKVASATRSAEQWSGVKYAYYDCRRYANLRGLTVRGTVKIWDTNLAAIGLLWARQQSDAVLERYIDAVYEPFWKRELDVEALAVIQTTLATAGADITGFEEFVRGEGAQQNQALQSAAFEAGIYGVPTYVVAEQLYFGREHLPRVRWHLSGEQGAAPDIAYPLAAGSRIDPGSAQGLQVCVDFASPDSFLALAPTLALARELELDIDWLPRVATQRSAGKLLDPASRGGRHRQLRADSRARDIQRYGPADMVQPVPGDASISQLAALALLWAKKNRAASVQEVVVALFDALWREPVAAQVLQTIAALLARCRVPGDFVAYAEGSGLVELEQLQATWAARGLIGTPTYFLGDEPFWGRQHLPLIRARLEQGTP